MSLCKKNGPDATLKALNGCELVCAHGGSSSTISSMSHPSLAAVVDSRTAEAVRMMDAKIDHRAVKVTLWSLAIASTFGAVAAGLGVVAAGAGAYGAIEFARQARQNRQRDNAVG